MAIEHQRHGRTFIEQRESNATEPCAGCAAKSSKALCNALPSCLASERRDGTNVIFIEVKRN